MKYIIVDDEPLARRTIEKLAAKIPQLEQAGTFNSAIAASRFMEEHTVDLIFLDIQMPHITGLEFAATIPKETLIIFTTAFAEYALDSYEVDAIDYLVKPIDFDRFRKAVTKAISYRSLLLSGEKENINDISEQFVLVKSERRYCRINLNEILFIEGLKDYVIIQTQDQRVITKMNLKNIHEQLPGRQFFRINKSYIINTTHVSSFDNNDVFIRSYEIAIGNSYREAFFREFVHTGKQPANR